MRKRSEISGLHHYDRVSGMHVLLDAVPLHLDVAAKTGPRHLSLKLTDDCNLKCPYCYTRKGSQYITGDMVAAVAAAADELQVLDLTLGGGEPTMHPEFPQFAKRLWSNHTFGLSVTTNGLLPKPLIAAAPYLSSVRVSIDNMRKPLTDITVELILQLSDSTHVGVNLLVPPGNQDWIGDALRRLDSAGAADVLILPEHDRGIFRLSPAEWASLDHIVSDFGSIAFSITAGARRYSSLPTLDTSHPDEFLFAHIDTHGGIHEYSWGPEIASGTTTGELVASLRQIHPIRRCGHESLV